MALIRWEPFREVEIMQRQINRLFDQMLSPQESDRLRGDVAHHGDIMEFTPPAEIHETTDAFKLRIELPGLKPDDLDVKVSPEAVEISRERRFETTTEEKLLMDFKIRTLISRDPKNKMPAFLLRSPLKAT